MEETVLEVNNLSIKFRHFSIKQISFQLQAGYILGIVGNNGAGKTTLMKLIQNVYVKKTGTVKIAGFDNIKQEVQAKNAIGFIMDQPFFEKMTVRENAKLFGIYYKSYDDAKFLEYIKRFEISLDKKIENLSKGMKTKFQLAFALAHHAKLLILDEPTGGLDPIFRREFLEILQDVVEKEEVGVIISTHITSDLDKVADYIALVDDGEMRFFMTKEDLFDQYKIVKGNRELLKKIPNSCFVATRKNSAGFQALTQDQRMCEKYITDTDEIVFEQATIEDIMYFMHKERREAV